MPDAATLDSPPTQYAELAEFAGGFIHEIKNRVSTLSLNLQLLAEDFENPESPRERRALEILCEMGIVRADWHCFGGKVTLARQIAERGHYLSIPANARRSESFTRMLQTLPRDRLLLETDCPYLGPERDGTNEPANVAGTADYAAELWGVPRAEVDLRLAENFERLFATAP